RFVQNDEQDCAKPVLSRFYKVFSYWWMSRTGTAEELPEKIGVPVALLPQPATLTMVTSNEPAFGPPPGEDRWMKTWRKPTMLTGPTGAAPPAGGSYTGTVTRESLVLT